MGEKPIPVGRSNFAPFVPDAKERHRRRQAVADKFQESARQWCERRGIEFRRRSHDGSWVMRKSAVSAIWVPATADLLLRSPLGNIRYHAHDWFQVRRVLCEKWNVSIVDAGPVLIPRERKTRKERRKDWK